MQRVSKGSSLLCRPFLWRAICAKRYPELMTVQDSITSPWSDSSQKLLSTSGYGIGSWPGKALLHQHPGSCSRGPFFSRLHVHFNHFKGESCTECCLGPELLWGQGPFHGPLSVPFVLPPAPVSLTPGKQGPILYTRRNKTHGD